MPTLGRRRLIGFLVVAVALAAARVAAPSGAMHAHPRLLPAASCGVERWTVKTLGDRPRLLARRDTTLAYLVSRPEPRALPQTRLPFERRVFRVRAAVMLVRPEADSDIHVVLQAGRSHMIAEAPAASCATRATRADRVRMVAARNAVRRCRTALVTGVAFFDFAHGQTGVAPNGIELHPILGFRCVSGSPPPAPPPPPPPGGKCAASYPDHCIPPPPPDLDCADVPYRAFRVLWNVPDPDPHRFDGNRDGVGCEG